MVPRGQGFQPLNLRPIGTGSPPRPHSLHRHGRTCQPVAPLARQTDVTASLAARGGDPGRGHRPRAAVRRALAPAGAASGAAAARPGCRRGGRPGRLRRHARPLAVAARPGQGAGLPAPDRGEPVPLGAAAPRRRRAVRRPPVRRRHAPRPPTCRAWSRTVVPPSSTRSVPLPTRQREVLVLRHYLELSEAEIADALGISRGSVKAHASRGSATLRELLADHLTRGTCDGRPDHPAARRRRRGRRARRPAGRAARANEAPSRTRSLVRRRRCQSSRPRPLSPRSPSLGNQGAPTAGRQRTGPPARARDQRPPTRRERLPRSTTSATRPAGPRLYREFQQAPGSCGRVAIAAAHAGHPTTLTTGRSGRPARSRPPGWID